MRNFRLAVLAVVLFSYTVVFACRINIGVLLPSIQAEFALSNSAAGALVGLFFLGYVATQIPAGLWFGKFGTRALTAVMLFLSAAITWLIGTASSLASLQLYRFCLGLVQGPVSIGSSSTVNNWFPPREKSSATGVYLLSNMLASMAAPPVIALVIVHYGWRYSLYLFAIPGVAAALVWYLLLRDRPQDSPLCSAEECAYISGGRPSTEQPVCLTEQAATADHPAQAATCLTTRRAVLASWNIRANTLAYFLMASVLYGLLTWIPSYLILDRHYSFLGMGMTAAAPWVGGAVGTIAGGWLSDKVFSQRRKPTMMITAFATVIMMAILYSIPDDPHILVAALSLTGFFIYLGWSSFTAYSMGITTAETYPLAISLVNSGGSLGGLVSPLVIGVILDMTRSYTAVFFFFGICALLALIAVSIIKEGPIDYP